MNTAELRDLIIAAFRDVTLDGGISLWQGEVCDNYGRDNDGRAVSEAKFNAIPRTELTEDWSALPLAELESYPYLAYLDARGFRYYIPAFLLAWLEDPSGRSMRGISTLSSLYPKRDSWLYHMEHYELLSDAQRTAIAHFLHELQHNLPAQAEDQRIASRALRDYWQQFLPRHPVTELSPPLSVAPAGAMLKNHLPGADAPG